MKLAPEVSQGLPDASSGAMLHIACKYNDQRTPNIRTAPPLSGTSGLGTGKATRKARPLASSQVGRKIVGAPPERPRRLRREAPSPLLRMSRRQRRVGEVRHLQTRAVDHLRGLRQAASRSAASAHRRSLVSEQRWRALPRSIPRTPCLWFEPSNPALRRTIASCVHCEDSRSLRYDQQAGGWVCFDGCGNTPGQKPGLKRLSPKKLQWKRSPLFEPVVQVDGVRRKLRHTELREAYRLWTTHRDIREGRFRG